MRTQCIVDGCTEERWYGPKGNNTSLYRCEKHQKEAWRESKAKSPKAPKGALLEDGTRRGRGKPRKDAPKPVKSEKISLVYDALIQAAAERASRPKPTPELIKVVVINRKKDMAQFIEVPVVSEQTFSEIRRPDELLNLLRGTGHIVIYADRDAL